MWRRVARGWEVVGPTSLRIIHISEATADELRARRAIAPWLLRDLLASGPEAAELIAELADQSLVSNPFGGSGAPTDDQIHEQRL